MSQLQKKIGRIQRRESPRSMGFGQVVREQPRGMLLGVVAADAAAAKAAVDAGADVVVFRVAGAAAAVTQLKKLDTAKVTAGAWLESLDDAGAASLREAACDFVIGTLEGTAATAVDTEAMGQVIVANESMDDTTLRALGPLGLDCLLVERQADVATLAAQLGLVRIASFASTPLVVTVTAETGGAELRVLRDSGTAMVLLPTGTAAGPIAEMVERLKAMPAPRRGRKESNDIAIVPAAAASHEHDHDDDDGDDE